MARDTAMAGGNLAIRLDGAVVALGGFPALAGVDLQVRNGELVALRGANGTGKSTLLRLCAGLTPLTRGTALVLGHDVVTQRDSVRSLVDYSGTTTASTTTLRHERTFGSLRILWGPPTPTSTPCSLDLVSMRVLLQLVLARCRPANVVVRPWHRCWYDERNCGCWMNRTRASIVLHEVNWMTSFVKQRAVAQPCCTPRTSRMHATRILGARSRSQAVSWHTM